MIFGLCQYQKNTMKTRGYPQNSIHTQLYTYTTLYIHNSGSVGLVTKSCATLATSWTVAHEAPLSMGFPRQEYWSGLPFPPPEDFPDPARDQT